MLDLKYCSSSKLEKSTYEMTTQKTSALVRGSGDIETELSGQWSSHEFLTVYCVNYTVVCPVGHALSAISSRRISDTLIFCTPQLTSSNIRSLR